MSSAQDSVNNTISSNTSARAPGEKEDGRGVSHATGKSIVPEGIQKAVPEKLEKVCYTTFVLDL